MTPCDLAIPWCLQGLCCAWRLWRVGRVAGCGGRGCCLVCLQAVGRLGRCRCCPGPAVLDGSGRAGDSLISAVWVLVLVWFLRVLVRGFILSSPSGKVCSLSVWLSSQPRILLKGGGGGELSETRPVVQFSCAPTSYVS